MTTTIKITELTDIGANLASSTVLPVVNMAGTPTTQKTVLGNIANVILEGAGTDYSPVAMATTATTATTAGTVTTAAQPNITSVGTLGNVVVSGNANVGTLKVSGTSNLGPVGNVTITGGTSGQVLTTNGSNVLSWTTVSGGGANTGNIGFTDNAIYSISGVIVENADLTHGATAALSLPNNANTTNPIQITNSYGNVQITAGASPGALKNWKFDTTGNLTTPGNIIGPASANFTIFANAGVHDFVFGSDGTFTAPDNVVLGGTRISIGPGASNLSELTNAVFIASTTGDAYIQGVIENVSDNGSADWVALGHRGDDSGGWADMGFTSSGFNDANYTITGPGDGYVFAETYTPGTIITGDTGGNLVLATGSQGTVNDIIFGTGGFLTGNIFGRISDSNNSLELTRTGASLTFPDGTVAQEDIEGTGNFGFEMPADVGFGILADLGNSEWSFGANGNLTTPSNLVIGANSGGGSSIYQFDAPLQVIGEGANSAVIVGWTANSSGPEDVVAIAFNNPLANGASNLVIGVGNNASTVNYWNFDNTGNLTLPDNGLIKNSGGNLTIKASGEISGGSTAGNSVIIQGGNTGTGDGGHIVLVSGRAPGAGGHAGNINIIAANGAGVDGIISLTTAGGNWTFDDAGNLIIPGVLSVPNNDTVSGTNEAGVPGVSGSQTFNAQLTYSPGIDAVQVGWTVTGNNLVGTTTVTAVDEYSPGFYEITTDTAVTNPFWYNDVYTFTGINYSSWTFNPTGSITFPTLTVDIHNGGNQTAQTLQFGDNTQQAIITGPTPTGNNNAERLIIQGQRGAGTGEGGDVYFWAGDGDTAGGDIKIYAGDADNVSAGYGGYINITGGQGFDGGGDVSITGGRSTNSAGAYALLVGGLGATTGGTANVQGGQGAVAGGVAELKGGYGGGSGGNVNITGGVAGNGLAEYGNVNINVGAGSWVFGNDGNLTLSGGGSIFSTNSTPSGAPGNTITLQPAGAGIPTNQKLMIYPTAADGDHIHMTSGNLYETELFLGSDNFYAKLANTGDIVLHANTGLSNATWTFSANSSLILPGAGVQMDAATNALLTSGIANTTIGTFVQGADGGVSWEYQGDGADANTSYGAVGLDTAGTANTANLRFKVQLVADQGNASTNKEWLFDTAGNLTLPGNTFAVNYANGTQVSIGGGGTPAGNNNEIQFNSNGAFTASGNLTFTDTVGGGTVEIGNELNLLGNGTIGTTSGNLLLQPAGNIVMQASASNLVFDITGNLILPGNTLSINYNNGTAAFGNISSVNLTGSASNVLYGNGTFAAPVAEASFSIQTANFNANAGSRYGVNTSGGAVTATLPASPATGAAIFFADAGGAYASNNLTIARNGQTIMGASSDLTVSTNNQSVGLFYNGTTWRTYNAG